MLSTRAVDAVTLEQFKATALRRHAQAETEQALCLVCRTPGHERAPRSRACARAARGCRVTAAKLPSPCRRRRALRAGQAATVVRALPGRWLPALGRNRRAAVPRVPPTPERIPPPSVRALARFIAQGPWTPLLDGQRAVMPPVCELVQLQLLAGLQLADRPARAGRSRWIAWRWRGRTSRRPASPRSWSSTRPAARDLRVAADARGRRPRRPATDDDARAGTRCADVWDLGVFAINDKQVLDFTHIHQRWLRDAAKGYVIERLATRKTRTAHRDLQLAGPPLGLSANTRRRRRAARGADTR